MDGVAKGVYVDVNMIAKEVNKLPSEQDST